MTGDDVAPSDEVARLRTELVDAHERLAELANLYVTTVRIHERLERSSVEEAIREVVISLVGSECFGLFEWREGTLHPTTYFGLAPAQLAWARDVGPRVIYGMTETVVVREPSDVSVDGGEAFVALIRLRDDGSDVGALVLFEMLPHKPRLGSADRALLEVVAEQGAKALRRCDAARGRSVVASAKQSSATQGARE